MKHISIFIISAFLFLSQLSFAQVAQDSITYKERYGLTLGVDLSKLGRSFLDDDYEGLEIFGDYRLTEDLYIAAEIGNTVVEKYLDLYYPERNPNIGALKDMSAASVLVLAVASAIVGCIIFIPKILNLL